MPLTATVDNANAQIALYVDFRPDAGTQTFATLNRHVGSPTAPAQYVRGLYLTTIIEEQAYVFDTEAPLDTPVYYTAVGNPGNIVLSAGPFTITSNGVGWIKDPGRPWANFPIDMCNSPEVFAGQDSDACAVASGMAWVGFSEKTYAADAGLFPVLNTERPADVYARRKRLSTEISFLSRELADRTTVYELFTAGGPIFLQLPGVYGWTDDYLQPGDLTEDYISRDQRRPWRLWTAPATMVSQPIGEPQGTDDANLCGLQAAYPTFAQMTATGLTWGQIAAGQGY